METDDADTALHGLLDYCTEHKVYISPKIAARRVPGRGLGIYSTQPIQKGDKLMHAPVDALLTTKSIPYNLISRIARKSIPVHAQLAIYLTWLAIQQRQQNQKQQVDDDNDSDTKDKEEQGKDEAEAVNSYARWMATWPDLETFLESVPMLWPERVLQEIEPKTAAKRRKMINGSNSNSNSNSSIRPPYHSILPAPLLGRWSGGGSGGGGGGGGDNSPSPSLLAGQRQKLAEHIKHANKVLGPILSSTSSSSCNDDNNNDNDITNPSNPIYWTFMHMWSCVNSRSFYYLPTIGRGRQQRMAQAPSDPNEAMALSPGMDLFNHADKGSSGVKVQYGKDGYDVTADRDYNQAGEEILLSYGAHTNDVLWTEYGFLLDQDENAHDSVQIDSFVVLDDDQTQKEEDHEEAAKRASTSTEILQKAGYLGDFWLKTKKKRKEKKRCQQDDNDNDDDDDDDDENDDDDEVVCYRTEIAAWWKVLSQHDLERVLKGVWYPNRTNNKVVYARHKAQICQWLAQMTAECEGQINLLKDMSSEQKADILGDSDQVMLAQGVDRSSLDHVRAKRVECRYALCLRRWEQLRDLSL